ncbi:MAG TPA: polysaccharide deacetylase family protein [Bryobacteraceae bacterium]
MPGVCWWREVKNISGLLPLLLCGLSGAQTNLTVARWPQDRAAAISLTFDDAMISQLDHVGPILRKYSLHGTFFVTTGTEAWRNRIVDWKRLASEGNEIGGHTVHHPCLLERIEPHAQGYSPEMMEAEIRDSAQAILREIGSRHGLTFAYPCGNMSFGQPADQARNEAVYLRFVSEHFYAARAYGWPAAVTPDELSILSVPDLGFTAGRDFRSLLEMADAGLRNHQWGVFTFHGVGGQWLSVTTEDFDELAAYLARHSEIWTTTFGDAVRYIQESKALVSRLVESNSNSYRFVLTWPLDTQIFNLPLTLIWQMPASWTACDARADDKAIEVRLSARPSGSVALVDIPSSTHSLMLEKRTAETAWRAGK